MADSTVTIHIATQEKALTVNILASTFAESLCTQICKDLQISPIASSLFAFQIRDSNIFLANNSRLEKNNILNLRIRFKVPNATRLQELDPIAYDYYFHQVRKDVLDNNVPEIIYSKHKEELLGLGITDMYRVMIEERKNIQEIMKDYKKYIPPEVTKKHLMFAKKPIYNTLSQLQKSNLTAGYVIERFLKQLESLAPNYLSEDYKVKIDKEGSLLDGTLFVMPFHKDEPGLRIHYEKRSEWEHLCTINELCFLTIREDGTIEISRVNGIPIYLKFDSIKHMYSFVSICDGYYRLICKWTFNLCKDVYSPTLKTLHSLKCHGPVGGVFSYRKLEQKRSNKPGCFILRQCELHYDVYYVDVCTKSRSKPLTFKIEQYENAYIFNGKFSPVYSSVSEIIQAYKNNDEELQMLECVPPSEYDKSQLLLCEITGIGIIKNVDQNDLENLLMHDHGPRCIAVKDLQLYKGSRIEGSEKVTYFYRARWNIAQDKKMNVAMKMLKQDSSDKFFKEFIEQAGQWTLLKSSSIVRLYGVTLRSPVSMILEYFPYGPLDVYLIKKKVAIQVVDLVEAAASLATALWHLAENGVVHGNIRCRKMLVACHDPSRFTVKLSDQGLHSYYKDQEIHWIAIEYHNNVELARRSAASDVWAFATTLWEIFSYGNSPAKTHQPLTKKNYASGIRLNIPNGCPKDIYAIMRGCWMADLHNRSRPQAIMRDVNHLLYQVFNSRRSHYSVVFPKNGDNSSNDMGLENFLAVSDVEGDTSNCTSRQTSLTDDGELDTISSDFSNQNDFDFSNRNIDQSQDIYEFEGYNVVLQGLIGKGNYGNVFKGSLQKDGSCESREVAVKRVIANTESSQLDDFYQETKIATTLKHRNIVEILGVVDKPEILLIMEFIQHGSLKTYLNIHREKITRKQLLKYALDVAAGMEYLETKNVVHRDLAARNILVVNEDQVKISDFGLSREMDKGYYMMKSSRPLPLYWYAPESKRNGKFSSKSDVWSYGVTIWEMFSYGKEPPSWDQDLTQDKVSTRLPPPANCPNAIYIDLMIACWQMNPCERPSFTQLHTTCEKLLADLSLG